MNQIPINEEKNATYNKKAVKIILLLVVCGIVTGSILSYVFIDEANQRIDDILEGYMPILPYEDYNAGHLATSDIILPSLGIIIICISIYLLLGLIIVYISIFLFRQAYIILVFCIYGKVQETLAAGEKICPHPFGIGAGHHKSPGSSSL